MFIPPMNFWYMLRTGILWNYPHVRAILVSSQKMNLYFNLSTPRTPKISHIFSIKAFSKLVKGNLFERNKGRSWYWELRLMTLCLCLLRLNFPPLPPLFSPGSNAKQATRILSKTVNPMDQQAALHIQKSQESEKQTKDKQSNHSIEFHSLCLSSKSGVLWH